MKDIVIYGCGGMGREIAWLIEEINKAKTLWNIIGYIDDNIENIGKKYYKYTVLGGVDWLIEHSGINCVIAVGNSNVRKTIATKIYKYCKFPILVHPSVNMNESISIGEGCMISANSVFTTDIKIGKHSFVNANSCIMHDVEIGDYSTIFLGVNIAGGVHIQDCVEIGSGTTIIPNKNIGSNSTIGAGAVVVKDILANCTAVGAPAKPIKFHE